MNSFWLRQLARGRAALIFLSVSGSIRIRNFTFSSVIYNTQCVQEVKKTNGSITFKDTLKKHEGD